MFSYEFCEISQKIFLQNTSGRLLLMYSIITLKNTDVWKRWFLRETENERTLLLASFTRNFLNVELVFVLTQDNAFSRRFHFKANRKSIFSSKKRDFQNSPPFKRSVCFYVTIAGNFEYFQYFKVGLLPSKKKCFIYFNEDSLNIMKNVFYFILKALFVFKIFKFLSWPFGHAEKAVWLER